MCEMCPFYQTPNRKPVDIISTAEKKIHGSQGSTQMLGGRHVYNFCVVRSLHSKNNYFRVKMGHPFKVKLTCHAGQPNLRVIFGTARFPMIACPFFLISENYFLKIAIGFVFSPHKQMFLQFILTPPPPTQKLKTFRIVCTKGLLNSVSVADR